MMLDDLKVAFLVPIVVALVQVIKTTTNLDERFLPFTSLMTGIIATTIYAWVFYPHEVTVYSLIGVVVGLSASGLYDQKHIVQ